MSRLPSRDWIAGAVLVMVGLFFLAGQLVPGLERFMPLLVGLALVGVFLVTRSTGALVAGGIVSGIGVGAIIATQPGSALGGGAFLVSLGGGFLLVSLLATLYQIRDARAWPLVPGSVLITIGVVILAGNQGRTVLDIAQTWWPVALVLIGAWVLFGARHDRGRGVAVVGGARVHDRRSDAGHTPGRAERQVDATKPDPAGDASRPLDRPLDEDTSTNVDGSRG